MRVGVMMGGRVVSVVVDGVVICVQVSVGRALRGAVAQQCAVTSRRGRIPFIGCCYCLLFYMDSEEIGYQTKL